MDGLEDNYGALLAAIMRDLSVDKALSIFNITHDTKPRPVKEEEVEEWKRLRALGHTHRKIGHMCNRHPALIGYYLRKENIE